MKFSRSSRSAQPASQLAQVRPGDSVNVTELDESMDPVLRRRLEALGFRDGAQVTCLRKAPLGSPMLYRVCGAEICLRKEQADCIQVSQESPESTTPVTTTDSADAVGAQESHPETGLATAS